MPRGIVSPVRVASRAEFQEYQEFFIFYFAIDVSK